MGYHKAVPLIWPICHNLLQAYLELLHAVLHLNVLYPPHTFFACVCSSCFPDQSILGIVHTFFLHGS